MAIKLKEKGFSDKAIADMLKVTQMMFIIKKYMEYKASIQNG